MLFTVLRTSFEGIFINISNSLKLISIVYMVLEMLIDIIVITIRFFSNLRKIFNIYFQYLGTLDQHKFVTKVFNNR